MKSLKLLLITLLLLALAGCSAVAQEDYDAALAEANDWKDMLAELRDDHEDDLSALEKELTGVRDEVAALEDEIASLADDESAKAEQKDALQTQIADLEAERDDLLAQIAAQQNAAAPTSGSKTHKYTMGIVTYTAPQAWVLEEDSTENNHMYTIPKSIDANNPLAFVSHVTSKNDYETNVSNLKTIAETYYTSIGYENVNVADAEEADAGGMTYTIIKASSEAENRTSVPRATGFAMAARDGFYFITVVGNDAGVDDAIAIVLDLIGNLSWSKY